MKFGQKKDLHQGSKDNISSKPINYYIYVMIYKWYQLDLLFICFCSLIINLYLSFALLFHSLTTIPPINQMVH